MATISIPEDASEVAILGRVIMVPGSPLSPDTARSILALSFAPADIDRMQNLAQKARDGSLTDAEQVEIENFERAGHVLSLLKSRARMALASQTDIHSVND